MRFHCANGLLVVYCAFAQLGGNTAHNPSDNQYLLRNGPDVGESFPEHDENALGTASQGGRGAVERRVAGAENDDDTVLHVGEGLLLAFAHSCTGQSKTVTRAKSR